MPYAQTNGISLYYEEHGSGDPLILLHGGLGSIEMVADLIGPLSEQRRVIAVDLRGHGRTPDAEGPFRVETMADDVAGLIDDTAGVLGYSLGAAVALRLAIQHPERVRNLILVSGAFKRAGNHPEVIEQFDRMGPEFAQLLKQSPVYDLYNRIAPRPEDFETFVAKSAELVKVDFDWSDELAAITARTLLVYPDQDCIGTGHIAEFAARLGIGVRDAGWDGSAKQTNQLAVLPGATHYDVIRSPLFVPVVRRFLGGAA